MNTRTYLFILVFIFVISSPALSVQIENVPLFTDFYLGIINGVGTGLNFGISGNFTWFKPLILGLEAQQIISDHNYSAIINATRYGYIIGLESKIRDKDINFYYYFGNLRFQVSRWIDYKSREGDNYRIEAEIDQGGHYQGIGIEYPLGDNYYLIVRYHIDSIADQGSVDDYEINISRKFHFE